MENIKKKIIDGYRINKDDALKLYKEPDLECLFAAANAIRQYYLGDKVDLCSIMNAKSGRCSEDCHYCAQSSRYRTGIDVYALISKEKAAKRAQESFQEGVHRFSLVTSGRRLTGIDFDNILDIFGCIHSSLPQLQLCASLGMISYNQAVQLKQAGVTTYHHNLETNEKFFP